MLTIFLFNNLKNNSELLALLLSLTSPTYVLPFWVLREFAFSIRNNQ